MNDPIRHRLKKGGTRLAVFACLVLVSLLKLSGQPQSVYFSRYIGLKYLEDPRYRIDIFNPSPNTRDLSGHLLVSRQFVAKIPKGTRVAPLSTLSLGKTHLPEEQLDLPFETINDFIIRIPRPGSLGDYLILFDPQGDIVDAFFYSPHAEVSFLPDQGELITFDNQKIPFSVPAETHPAWSFLQIAPDPALAYLRIDGRWQPAARNRNTLPATEYGPLEAKYVQGIVSVTLRTRFERACLPHQLERSKNGKSFELLHQFPTSGNHNELTEYRYYDDQVMPDQRYFYRAKNVDRFGFIVYSNLVEVLTDDLPKDFGMEVLQVNTSEGLSIRISSREARKVRIKLLDEQFRELALLFYDQLAANSQHLIRYQPDLPNGKYYIVADAGIRRVYETLIVSE